MIIFHQQDLEQSGITTKRKNNINIDGRLYKKSQTIPKKFKTRLKEYIDEFLLEELKVLIIEHKLYYSIWTETEDLHLQK